MVWLAISALVYLSVALWMAWHNAESSLAVAWPLAVLFVIAYRSVHWWYSLGQRK